MRFQKNAQVLAADGTMIGTIDRLVVDPQQTDITHLVVSQGALLDHDSLVPVAEVDRTAPDDSVILRSGVSPQEFAPFVEDRYRRVTVERPMFGPPGLALYPLPNAPGDYVGWNPDRPAPTDATEDAPSGSSVIGPGAAVITSDGRRLGKVDEVVTSDDGSIDGVIAHSGILWWKRHWLIPIGWISRIADGVLHVSVTREQAREHAGPTPTWMSRSTT